LLSARTYGGADERARQGCTQREKRPKETKTAAKKPCLTPIEGRRKDRSGQTGGMVKGITCCGGRAGPTKLIHNGIQKFGETSPVRASLEKAYSQISHGITHQASEGGSQKKNSCRGRTTMEKIARCHTDQTHSAPEGGA